jgi:hypothetical protein
MKKYEANRKDRAHAMRWRLLKIAHKVGGSFKGCQQCGVRVPLGRRTLWLTGHNVYRAFVPARTGWTWYCWDCSARDLRAWDDTRDELGTDFRSGCRSPEMTFRTDRQTDRQTDRREEKQ